MELKRRPKAALSMAAALFCLIMLFSFSSGAHSQQWRLSWKEVDLSGIVPWTVLLFDVQLSDSKTAWLLGYEWIQPIAGAYQGHIFKLKWQGDKWVLSEHYKFPYVITVLKPVSENSIWAVANRGSRSYCCNGNEQILHKDESGWHEETEQLEGVFLGSIVMLPGEQEGWAAGGIDIPNCKFVCSKGYLLHFKNGKWVSDPGISGFERSIGIDFAGSVGYAFGTSIHKYDGQNWTELSLPQLPPVPTAPPNEEACPGVYFDCFGIEQLRLLGPDEFWAFGRRFSTLSWSTAEPILLHMRHGAWQVFMPGNTILQNRPPGTQALVIQSFSMGSDGYGFLAPSPIQFWGWKAFPQIIEIAPNGSLSYEQLPQIEHVTLSRISNSDANHALALGMHRIQIYTPHGPESQESPVLLSYVNDGILTPTPTPISPIPLPQANVANNRH